ncbi:Pentatricopeptide repeat (PPR) superfamily protein [Rhynchospora pubera]|uniref:Pentatricopeptide repeat (PPR) superfamily protein n=1 Tax=Rhynchospora pubera TaxID=906938 RepID=A0AAV8HH02_9POAL|nr:Pentatricopeptide repeat (PPR) superfamily protein [Rhynchospora pubera]
MENTMRKLQQRYRRASEEMEKWEEQQSYLLSSFNNASSIIDRLQVLRESKNYGTLQNVSAIKEALLAKQLDSLETYFFQMRLTLKEFHEIVKSLDKIARDANQIVKSGASPTSKQMQLRVGIWSSLKDCLDGLISIRDMHQDEFALKSAIISSLSWKSSSAEIADFRRLLIDQPNIPKDKVQTILDLVFADEIS